MVIDKVGAIIGQKDIHNIHEYGDDMETAGHSLQRCADGTYGWLAPTKDAANTCASACADTPLPACAAGDVIVAEVHPDGSPEDCIYAFSNFKLEPNNGFLKLTSPPQN